MVLDKMYKYKMDPTRTLGATERTWNAGRTDEQTDERTDGRSDEQMDGRTQWNQYTPQQLCLFIW